MINGSCFTNIDFYKGVKWPGEFVAIPQLDDRVRSIDGKHDLRVIGITHAIAPVNGGPFILVELHR